MPQTEVTALSPLIQKKACPVLLCPEVRYNVLSYIILSFFLRICSVSCFELLYVEGMPSSEPAEKAIRFSRCCFVFRCLLLFRHAMMYVVWCWCGGRFVLRCSVLSSSPLR